MAAFVLNTTEDVYYAGVSQFTLTNKSSGAIQWEWDFGNGDTSMAFEPQYQYQSPGVYTITMVARNGYGCTDTANAILDVRVPEDIYVPNAFTPNGDATNDYFSVAERNIVNLKVFIYDRWGEQIYTSDRVNFAWDGNYRGEPAKQDVYVYLIKATGYHGRTYDLKGTVTLVR
jgi:gliding motility-associated-like protein